MTVKELSSEEVLKMRAGGLPPKIETPSNGKEEFSIDRLIKFGHLVREVPIVEGLTITLKTLTEKERREAFSLVENKDLTENALVRAELINKPILVCSIEKINDTVFDTLEKKKALLQTLDELPTALIDLIEIEYRRLLLDQMTLINEGLKKKS